MILSTSVIVFFDDLRAGKRMDDFFTVASFGTLAGSVAAVVVIVSALRHAVNWGPRWFGLIESVAVSFFAWSLTKKMASASTDNINIGVIQYVIVLLNGCLIYTSAFGIQNTVIAPDNAGNGTPVEPQTSPQPQSLKRKLIFRSHW